MRKRLGSLAALALLASATGGCHSSTSCDIGNVTCDQDETKVQECVGPDKGGDADGEIKVISNCAEQGEKCMEVPAHGKMVAGCVTQACYDTKVAQCFSLGDTDCAYGQYLLTCTLNADGCQTYSSIDCAKTAKQCVASGSGASCSQ